MFCFEYVKNFDKEKVDFFIVYNKIINVFNLKTF